MKMDDKLLFYQEEVIKDKSPRKLVFWPRRAGKSTAIALEAATWAIIKENKRIVVIDSINKTNLSVLWKDMRQFIIDAGAQDMIERDVSAPYYKIQLTNGSCIRGFSAGREGISVRGQDADHIFIDNAGYITQKALMGSIMPILQSTQDATIAIYFSKMSELMTELWKDEDNSFINMEYCGEPVEDDHEGMVYNPFTERWSWL